MASREPIDSPIGRGCTGCDERGGWRFLCPYHAGVADASPVVSCDWSAAADGVARMALELVLRRRLVALEQRLQHAGFAERELLSCQLLACRSSLSRAVVLVDGCEWAVSVLRDAEQRI